MNEWRLGVATGYTRSSLHRASGSEADSDNYHLAVYGNHQSGKLGIRGGVSHTRHRIDTKRTVNYGIQADHDTAWYSAHTGQLFAEAGYSIRESRLNLEPFASLTYAEFRNNSIAENGGAAALHGGKQHKKRNCIVPRTACG